MSVPKTEAVIRDYNGRPTVFVNGQPQPLPGFNASSRPGIYERASEFFYAHKMGVYIIQPRVERFWQGRENIWTDVAGNIAARLDELNIPIKS